MKLLLTALYLLFSAIILALGIYWLRFHLIWASCFAISTSGVIIFHLNYVRRFVFAKKRLLRQINNNVESEKILNWLSRNRFGNIDRVKDYNEGGLTILLLLITIAILCFYYFPWTPSDTLEQVLRVLVYLIVPSLFSLFYWIFMDMFMEAKQKGVVDLIYSSTHESCKLISMNWLSLKVQNDDESIRVEAIKQLVEIGDERSVELLIQTLKDKDKDVRTLAADALENMGDTSVEPLIDALKDNDWHVRASAAKVLGKIKNTKVVQPLIDALKDIKPLVRVNVAYSLGVIKDKQAVSPLIDLLNEKDTFLTKHVKNALKKINTPAAIKAIEKMEKEEIAQRQKVEPEEEIHESILDRDNMIEWRNMIKKEIYEKLTEPRIINSGITVAYQTILELLWIEWNERLEHKELAILVSDAINELLSEGKIVEIGSELSARR